MVFIDPSMFAMILRLCLMAIRIIVTTINHADMEKETAIPAINVQMDLNVDIIMELNSDSVNILMFAFISILMAIRTTAITINHVTMAKAIVILTSNAKMD